MIRLGTRGSELALCQSTLVAQRLRAAGHEVELVVIRTRGDATDRPFREIEGRAFFTKELDDALLDRSVDLAVHSLKDLPTDDPPRVTTICVLKRADPRDLLLLRRDVALRRKGGSPGLLPPGIRLGTSSARRFAELDHAFPGVVVVDLRGNVPTRVEKLRRGDFDGIVIAAAGVERLGLDLADLTVVPLDPPRFLPAPGQGVLAARFRAEDELVGGMLRGLVDADTADAARAERALLEKLDGGCSLPLGALATCVKDRIVLDASLARDGEMRCARVVAVDPVEAAEAAARALLAEPPASPASSASRKPLVLLTRPDDLDRELSSALRERGLAVLSQPAIRFEPRALDESARATLDAVASFDLVAFTSRQAVRAFASIAPRADGGSARARRIAALGPATADELVNAGLHADVVGDGHGAAAFAAELARELPAGTRVLHPCTAEPDPAFRETLQRAQVHVTDLPLYATLPVDDDPPLPDALLVVVLSSPSAARAFLARPRVAARLAEVPRRIQLVAGGATTAAELERRGRPPSARARSPVIVDLLPAIERALLPDRVPRADEARVPEEVTP